MTENILELIVSRRVLKCLIQAMHMMNPEDCDRVLHAVRSEINALIQRKPATKAWLQALSQSNDIDRYTLEQAGLVVDDKTKVD